jgi:hypothetical protein
VVIAVVFSLIGVGALAYAQAPTQGGTSLLTTISYSHVTFVGAAVTAVLLNSTVINVGPNSIIKLVANLSSPIKGDFIFAVVRAGAKVSPLTIQMGEAPTSLPQGTLGAGSSFPISVSYPSGLDLRNTKMALVTIVIKLEAASPGTVNLILDIYQAQPQPSIPGVVGYDSEEIPFQLQVSG